MAADQPNTAWDIANSSERETEESGSSKLLQDLEAGLCREARQADKTQGHSRFSRFQIQNSQHHRNGKTFSHDAMRH